LKALYAKHGAALPANAKSDGADLKKLLKGVLEEVDFDRVYVSDVKKLVTWYQILATHAPELLKGEEKAEEKPAKESPEKEKPKAKKAAPKKAEPKEEK
jgi:hypothetical protein